MLLATMPLMAQEKSLEEKLEEAKAAIEDQEWIIRQLEKNFFKVVAELNEELDFLRALSGKQLEEIESYLKEIASLKLASEEQARKLAQLEAMKAEQAKKVSELEAVKAEQAKRLKELERAIEEKAAKVTELEAIKAEQAERIERINILFGKVVDRMKAEIDSLNTKNAELVAAKEDLQSRLNAIDERYTQVVKEYEEQLLAAERLRDAYWKAQVKLAEKGMELAFFEKEAARLDRELAFFEEETAKLDREIASLKAEAAELEAANARLRRHRLLLGLGFIVAAYMACSAD
jgi:chromosome segregation ATPase